MAHSYIDKFGYRRQRANPISRVGVFPYTGEQIDQPKKDEFGRCIAKRDSLGAVIYKRNPKTGRLITDEDGTPIPEYEMQFGLDPKKLYPVLRGNDALFDPAAIESFNGLPIRVGHLMIGDEKKNSAEEKDKRLNSADKNPNDGCIFNVRQSMDEPEYLLADFCIYTDRMKEVLTEGKVKQLSLGYTCIYEPEEGFYKGTPYMFKQTNLRGNHLALVKHGRCGSSVCVYDQAVVTFDSLPEGITPMEDKKPEETEELDRAKALASAIKGGDEQLAQDCLDFADFPADVRKEALERCKAGKCVKKDDEKEVADKSPKSTKDDLNVPVPPSPKTEEEKTSEAKAPETAAASAPTETIEPAPNDNPAGQDVESPKDGEKPSQDCKDKAEEVHVCDKCGTSPCACAKEEEEAKTVKDCNQPVTEPTAQVPVSALQPKDEEKKDKEGQAKDCKDKAPVAMEEVVKEKVETEPTPEATEEVVEQVEEEKPTTDKAKAAKDKADVVIEEGKEEIIPEKPAKTAQDEYLAFVAEYTEAQALAQTLRPYIKETFDAAPMRVVDVARFAAKHIGTLAFVQDEADDEKVMTAVRGYVAAIAMDASPLKPEVFEDDHKEAEVIVQDEAVAPSYGASPKDLLDFMAK